MGRATRRRRTSWISFTGWMIVRHVAEDNMRALPARAELSARSARIDIGEDEDDQQRPTEPDRNAAQAANEAAAAGAEGAASG